MCNLYSMTRAREAVLRLFRVSDNRAEQFDARSAIFPGYRAPIIRKAQDGERELTVMNWGFVLLQEGRGAEARAEHSRRQDADELVHDNPAQRTDGIDQSRADAGAPEQ